MKKYLLSIIWLVIVAQLYSQSVMFSQNFQGSITGWNSSDNNGSGVVWAIQNNTIEVGISPYNVPYSFIDSGEVNRFTIANSANATTTINTDLNSPVINCSGHSAVLLEFLQWFDVYLNDADGIVQVSTDQITWTTVYDALQNSAQTNPELVDLDISAYAANQSKVYLKFNYATTNGSYWWVIDNIKVMDYAVNDIAVTSVNEAPITGISNQYQVNCTIQNKGSANITGLTLNYSVNGGNPVAEELTNFNLGSFQTINYSFQTTAKVTQPGIYPVLVYSSLPNGVQDDNTTNDSASTSVMFLANIPEKNVLLEEYATGVCGFCPGGAVYMDQLLQLDTFAIPVVLHTAFGTDAMSTADIITFGESCSGSAPCAAIDRVFFPNSDWLAISTGDNLCYASSVQSLLNNSAWYWHTMERHEQLSPVAIAANNIYNPSTRELTVNILPTFYGSVSGDFRVSCYVIEDSLYGTQKSYYYLGPADTSINPWYYQGAFVSASSPSGCGGEAEIPNYLYNNVVRDFIGTPWGWGTPAFGSGITAPAVDSQYLQSFTYTLSGNWNSEHVSLVAFVDEFNSNPNSGQNQVLNSVKMKLNGSAQNNVQQVVLTAVNDIPNGTDQLSLYPNPATNQVYVSYSINEPGRIGFEVYNSLGQVVKVLNESILGQGNYTAIVNTELLANGVYFLAMKRNNAPLQTVKFIVSR